MNVKPLRDKMDNMLTEQSTPALVALMIKFDAMIAASDDLDDKAAYNECQRGIYRVLEARHPEVEPHMDNIFGDESPEGIEFMVEHTYAECLSVALIQAGVVID